MSTPATSATMVSSARICAYSSSFDFSDIALSVLIRTSTRARPVGLRKRAGGAMLFAPKEPAPA